MTEKDKKIAKVVIGGIAAVVLFKIIMPKTDTSGGYEDPTGNGGTTTQPGGTFNASVVAETLYDAMKNSGTNEVKIINALKNVSPTQFAQVVKKFQLRSYNKTLGNQINLFPLTPLPLYGLQVWLENELSDDQYNILSLKYSPLL